MSTSRALKESVPLLRQEASELGPLLEKDVGGEPGRRNSPRLQNRPRSNQQRPQHLRFGTKGQAGLGAVRGALAFSVWEGLRRTCWERRTQ
jgi:hypothetical protein